MGCILMVQGILAVSRYLTVCRQYRWNSYQDQNAIFGWMFRLKKPLTIVLTAFGCFIPLFLMLLPALGIWGELGYMENTGINVIQCIHLLIIH